MIKKLLLLFVFVLFILNPAYAENIIAESLDNFPNDDTKDRFSVKVLEEVKFSNGFILDENSIITSKVIKTVEAKRGKRNGYIVIQPVTYQNSEKTEIRNIENEFFEGKVIGYSKKDFKKIALNTGLAAGGFFIKGIGQVFYFSKGLIVPNEDQSRISSAIHNVYENTPFKYIEKGAEIDIEQGDKLVIKFHRKNKK